jgi:hypothetical protein
LYLKFIKTIYKIYSRSLKSENNEFKNVTPDFQVMLRKGYSSIIAGMQKE